MTLSKPSIDGATVDNDPSALVKLNTGALTMTTVASQIGLPERDVTVLVSIFSVLGTSSRVNDEIIFIREEQQLARQVEENTNKNISFVEEEQRRSPGRLADIIFIDGDNRFAMETWASLKDTNPLTIPIVVTSDDNLNVTTEIVLKRPLMLKRVISALTEATNTTTKKSNPQSSSLVHVLVVDDSFPVRKYMEHILPMLVRGEIKIDFAISGEEAIQKISSQFYGLIFLDVIMPGMDGYKTCKRIKSTCSSQVVMLTSKKSPFDKVRGTMSGCDAYIVPARKRLKSATISGEVNSSVNHTGMVACYAGYFSTSGQNIVRVLRNPDQHQPCRTTCISKRRLVKAGQAARRWFFRRSSRRRRANSLRCKSKPMR